METIGGTSDGDLARAIARHVRIGRGRRERVVSPIRAPRAALWVAAPARRRRRARSGAAGHAAHDRAAARGPRPRQRSDCLVHSRRGRDNAEISNARSGARAIARRLRRSKRGGQPPASDATLDHWIGSSLLYTARRSGADRVFLSTFYAERTAAQVGSDLGLTEGDVPVDSPSCDRASRQWWRVPEPFNDGPLRIAPIRDEGCWTTGVVMAADANHRMEEHCLLAANMPAAERLTSVAGAIVALARPWSHTGDHLTPAAQSPAAGWRERAGVFSLTPGETVPCAAFPGDDLVVAALRADFSGISAVKLSVSQAAQGSIAEITDIPAPVRDHEVLWATPGSQVRRCRRHGSG